MRAHDRIWLPRKDIGLGTAHVAAELGVGEQVLGMISPVEFENRLTQTAQAA
jgi:hypothetical protein